MRVVVIGAGIVGVTTAYELAQQGHEVTVYERRGSVAAEASFATAGLIAPGQAAPWAAPGLRLELLKALIGTSSRLQFGAGTLFTQWPWLWRSWRAGNAARQAGHSAAAHRLAQFSAQRLQEVAQRLRLDFEQAQGALVVLRNERELLAMQPVLAQLAERGVVHRVVDADACRALEPGLSPAAPVHAALHLPQDGVGNCRQFAHQLKTEALRCGAHFRFDIAVRALRAGAEPVVALANGIDVPCDAVVVCAGAGSRALLAGVGVRLPLVPLQTCSVSAPLRHYDGLHAPGPRSALVDARHHVVITRLGGRVRVAGGLSLGGKAQRPPAANLKRLYRVLDEWFPGAVLARDAQHWQGAQATLPDGPPLLGPSGAAGVWLNVGHGERGWTLACGAARALADQISGQAPPVDLAGLTIARLR